MDNYKDKDKGEEVEQYEDKDIYKDKDKILDQIKDKNNDNY